VGLPHPAPVFRHLPEGVGAFFPYDPLLRGFLRFLDRARINTVRQQLPGRVAAHTNIPQADGWLCAEG
jgi:hypothetical protein